MGFVSGAANQQRIQQGWGCWPAATWDGGILAACSMLRNSDVLRDARPAVLSQQPHRCYLFGFSLTEERKKPGICRGEDCWPWVPPAACSIPRSTTWHQKNCTQGHSHAKYGEEGFFSPITFLTPKCFCWIHSTWNVELNEYWHYLLKLRELESKGTDLLLKRWEQLAVSERLWSSQGREHNRNTGNTNSWRADHVLELLE